MIITELAVAFIQLFANTFSWICIFLREKQCQVEGADVLNDKYHDGTRWWES